jgi:hypothetical protein
VLSASSHGCIGVALLCRLDVLVQLLLLLVLLLLLLLLLGLQRASTGR